MWFNILNSCTDFVSVTKENTDTDVHMQKLFMVTGVKAKKWHKSKSQTHITCVLMYLFCQSISMVGIHMSLQTVFIFENSLT